MKTIITLIIISTINLYSQNGHPEVEKFILKGYEEYNFNNVLLDPESPIEDFYLVTDIGEILKVENMGLNPIVQKVFMYDGEITEAESEGETHYFSVVSESETMLLATIDFMELDTIYQESGAEITDFRIDKGNLYILSNNGTEGKISYTSTSNNNWKEKTIPDIEYHRLFVMDSLLIVFKYLANDVTVYKSNIETEWELSKQLEQYIKNIADMKEFRSKISVFGNIVSEPNRVLYLDKYINYFDFGVSADNSNFINDLLLENTFDFNRDNIHVGNYLNDCECAFMFRFSFNGDIEQNVFKFLQTKSLNKIKSNKRAKNIQAVAVGTDGLILLINRSRTDINQDNNDIILDENANFTIFPNPVGNQSELNIESEEVINSLSITDISGKQSLNIYQIGQRNFTLPINNLASGVYFISVNGVSKKFVVE